jgi:EpsI family protein
MMSSNRISLTVAALMFTASVGAIVAQPSAKLSKLERAISLEDMIPRQFGDWREAPGHIQVVDPQQKELLDRSYSQVLSRTYVNDLGYRVMLSLAYGDNQREREAHLPEVCYPAQGFVIQENEPGLLTTTLGEIPVRRLFATMGARQEPLTYWFAVGGTAVQGKLQKKLVHLRYALSGRVPDGMLFRVSSIDPNQVRAYRMQDQFIDQLLHGVAPSERARLSGLGNS